jgi:hypothetical protein
MGLCYSDRSFSMRSALHHSSCARSTWAGRQSSHDQQIQSRRRCGERQGARGDSLGRGYGTPLLMSLSVVIFISTNLIARYCRAQMVHVGVCAVGRRPSASIPTRGSSALFRRAKGKFFNYLFISSCPSNRAASAHCH